MSMTIAQQFLGKLLVDAEKIAILSEPYKSTQERLTLEAIMISRIFGYAVGKANDSPEYGVRGAIPEEAMEAITKAEFSTDLPGQFAWENDPKLALEILEGALQDPTFRTVLEGAVIAFRELKEHQAEYIKQMQARADEKAD